MKVLSFFCRFPGILLFNAMALALSMYVHQAYWWLPPIITTTFITVVGNLYFFQAQNELVTKNPDSLLTLVMLGIFTIGFSVTLIVLKEGGINDLPQHDYPAVAVVLETAVFSLWWGWVAFFWNNPIIQELVARWRTLAADEEYEEGDDYFNQPYEPEITPHP